MFQNFKNIYHFLIALIFCLFYGYPAKNLKVVGVTGTDGKTTTVHLIAHILRSSGKKVSFFSSIKAEIDGKDYDTGFHVTTPDPKDVQKYLYKAKNAGSEYMVLEVTSHALHQNRVSFCNFLIGVLTNVTFEHMDYHKSYENYLKTKLLLLKRAKIAVFNQDDKSCKSILNIKDQSRLNRDQKSKKICLTYGLEKTADINPQNFLFKTSLPGEFNKYNILAAASVCKALGLDDNQIRRGIESFKLPKGREEIVHNHNFKVMIDFAHTPNAFRNILNSVKLKKGRLIHVFGAAGERDSQKRHEMGKISSNYANIIILTSEDPRSESVGEINRQIISGIKDYELRIKNRNLLEIPNRQEAIDTAIKIAKKGDFVLITGKGQEKSMNYGNDEEPWDEYKAVENALRLRSGSQ